MFTNESWDPLNSKVWQKQPIKLPIYANLARYYIFLSAINYILFGLNVCNKDGSIFNLLFISPGFYSTSLPLYIFNQCTTQVRFDPTLRFWIIILIVGGGLLLGFTAWMVKKLSQFIYLLYGFSILVFTVSLWNMVFITQHSNQRYQSLALISLINASLFIIATYIIDRSLANIIANSKK